MRALGRRVLDLSARFRPLWVRLVAFTKRGFLIRVTEVELGVIPLRLEHLGALHELSRLTVVRRLMLALTRRRLIFPVAAVVVAHGYKNSQGVFHTKAEAQAWLDEQSAPAKDETKGSGPRGSRR
jgi:hypothetical protein